MTRDTIAAQIEENHPDEVNNILLLDGLDDAYIGIVEGINRRPLALYGVKECIDTFIKDGMSEDEAFEHFEYNVKGAYVGNYTPIFLNNMDEV